MKTVRSLFPRGHQLPFTKLVSINCQSLPMVAGFDYVNEKNELVPIGEFKIFSSQNIQISKNQLKLRIRLDPNGVVVIQSVTVVVEGSNASKKSQNNDNQVEDVEMSSSQNDQNSQQAMETDENAVNSQNNEAMNNKEGGGDPKDDKDKKKKPKAVSIELQVEPVWIRGKLTDAEIMKYREIESNLILADKNWKEKTDAKNALEEYIYEWRDKMEGGGYDPFVEQSVKEVFMAELQAGEQWLYEQEDNEVVHSKSVYEEKMTQMKEKFSDGILHRKREFENRPAFLEQLGKELQQSRKLMETVEEEEKESMKKLAEEVDAKQKWMEETFASINALQTTSNPPVTCDQIRQQTESLDSVVRRILNDRNRRHEEKRRQAEEAAKKTAPPPPQPSQHEPQKAGDQTQTAGPQPTGGNTGPDTPHMDVDDEIHPTI